MVVFVIISALIIIGVSIYYFWYNPRDNNEDQDDFRKNKTHYMRSQLKWKKMENNFCKLIIFGELVEMTTEKLEKNIYEIVNF